MSWNDTDTDFWLPNVADCCSLKDLISKLLVICKGWNIIITHTSYLWVTRVLPVAPKPGELQRLHSLYPLIKGIHIQAPPKQDPCPANLELFGKLTTLCITISHRSVRTPSFVSTLACIPLLENLDICFKTEIGPVTEAQIITDILSGTFEKVKHRSGMTNFQHLHVLRVRGVAVQMICMLIQAPHLQKLILAGLTSAQEFEENINICKVAFMFPTVKCLHITNLAVDLLSLLLVTTTPSQPTNPETKEFNEATMRLNLDTLLLQNCIVSPLTVQPPELTRQCISSYKLITKRVKLVLLCNLTYHHPSTILALTAIQKEYELAAERGLDVRCLLYNPRHANSDEVVSDVVMSVSDQTTNLSIV